MPKYKEPLGPNVENQDPSDVSAVFEDHPGHKNNGYDENETEDHEVAKPSEQQFPPPIMEELDEECLVKCRRWLSERLEELIASHNVKMAEFATYENAYKALPGKKKQTPFVGACNEVIPVIAMAVDPVQSRLDIGIMKQQPVFSVQPLRKSLVEYRDCLEEWLEFNQRHRWKLRQVAAPRFYEFCKFGTMAFKTIYDRIESPIKTWERSETSGKFLQKKKKLVKFTGARVVGIPMDRLYFPPGYATVDECPIMGERLTLTYEQLRVAESSGKITDVDKLGHSPTRQNKSDIEDQQEVGANHEEPLEYKNEYELYELWFDYDIDDDGYPESLVAIFEPERRIFLQLTYNWYFHQRKPYTVIPYTVQDGTLYGIGLAEMILPFQNAITRWHQMASDNAYLANIRMYIAKKNSGIEEVPRVYVGRVFYVDNPDKDLKPFQAADIYPSTMTERQNLFGMVEKRTGVSDYLTGRESPLIGSRATATSTIALIQEGTKRVEETLENIRGGFADVSEKSFCIWIQYGTEDLEDLVFGSDYTAEQIEDFFSMMTAEHVVNGAIGITLKATDAGENKQARQQMQLSLISILMGFFEKQIEAGEAALQMLQQGQTQGAMLIADTLTAARKMFNDLLKHYDIRNPEQYLPDITKYLQGPQGPQGGPQQPPEQSYQEPPSAPPGLPPGLEGLPGMGALSGGGNGALQQRPEGAPNSGRPPFLESLAG